MAKFSFINKNNDNTKIKKIEIKYLIWFFSHKETNFNTIIIDINASFTFVLISTTCV